MKNSMVHFEIPADDVERAKAFYTQTFGWEINKFEMPADSSTGGAAYYGVRTTDVDERQMVKTPGAISGGLMKRMSPQQPFMNYIRVDSIKTMIEKISANRGTIVMPKTEIAPEMGWIATFRDTENNLMGLHELARDLKK
jgi:uncharacterized protein